MSGMDENPHYGRTENWQVRYGDATQGGQHPDQFLALGQIEATLALAYEQRTANLIALFQWHDAQGDLTETTNDLYREIIARATSTEAKA